MSAGLVPELMCSDFRKSLDFYTNILGFSIRYGRPEERFAYLEREQAQLMLEQPIDPSRTFLEGKLEYPFGRGVNFQIETLDLNALYEKAEASNARIALPMEERWYRRGDEEEVGQLQFIVMDPDGYLLRFCQMIGTRQVSSR